MTKEMPEQIWAYKEPEQIAAGLQRINQEWREVPDCRSVRYARADLVPKWQPIETAPRDGTKILCGRFIRGLDDKNGFMAVDRYNPEYNGFGNFNSRYWPATHWMPLPPAPEAEDADRT